MEETPVEGVVDSSDKVTGAAKLLQILKTEFPKIDAVVSPEGSHAVASIAVTDSPDFFAKLRDHKDLKFNFLVDITAVDYLDTKDARFEMVYHFLSLDNGYRIRVKIAVEEANPSVPSIVSLWDGANFMERETWDMYGIKFEGHPDLRRILMYDEFKGHPLRKDYPVQLKQPRVALRSPEVKNTARNMVRPDLVAITPRKPSLN